MNLVIMKGRMTADATIRTANSGTTAASFSLAIDRRFKDKVTGDKITDFIRMTAFGKTAEFIQKYTGRGKEILIEGEMQQNDFTDKNGAEQHTYQVVVNQVHFCGSKNDSAQYGTAQTEPTQPGLPENVQNAVEQFEAVVADGEVLF
jgi:single-strand DNA-binding protein